VQDVQHFVQPLRCGVIKSVHTRPPISVIGKSAANILTPPTGYVKPSLPNRFG
jgi:hypothetical protein